MSLDRDIEVKKAENIEDKETGVTGMEINFVDEQGNERRALFDDYNEAVKDCPDCGKKRYKCSLERDAKVKHPSEREHGSRSMAKSEDGVRDRTDVRDELDL